MTRCTRSSQSSGGGSRAPVFSSRRAADPATSLGVPTWVYPDEPVNLFSSHIAKYFSNSMREEGLIAIGSHGVVIASDTPGTVREVFQAAEQDSYWVGDRRSPMVLLEAQAASALELLMRYGRRDRYAGPVKSFAPPRQARDFT